MSHPFRKLQLEKKHKRGKRTFFFLFIQKAWWLVLIGFGFFYLSWAVTFGGLYIWATSFLNSHPNWYLTTGMFGEWFLLVGISFLLVGYLRANVFYRMYKFILDEYAVHLRSGLFYIRETTIPYHQISNVHIGRPYHYRMFGVAQLDIVTAADRSDDIQSRSNKKFLMPMIDLALARVLSRQLLENAARSRRHQEVDEEEIDEEKIDKEIEEDNELDEDEESEAAE